VWVKFDEEQFSERSEFNGCCGKYFSIGKYFGIDGHGEFLDRRGADRRADRGGCDLQL
jgi:hypothetical protein